VSTANREKRKQAKRKTREKKRNGERHRKSKAFAVVSAGGADAFAATDSIAQGWLGLGDRWYEDHAVEDVKEGEKALLLDYQNANMPNLYYTLAAEGVYEPEVFLRFGEMPASGRSAKYKNSRTIRGYEEGVSCFPACRTRGGHVLLDLGSRLHSQLLALMGLSGRAAYLIGGDIVGSGGDGEPVLRGAYYREILQPLHFVATKTPSWTVEAWNAKRIPE